MPIIYSHEMKQRNPKPTPQRKYSNGQWVVFEGQHCQVKGYTLENGVPMYTLKLPTTDGLGHTFTVHQREITEVSAVTVSEKDREDNRNRVKAEIEKYVRD
jgi:hypothetical protein